MADVDFNEPQYARAYSGSKQGSWMSRLMISWGFAKDEAGAQKALGVAAFIIVVIALCVYFLWGT